jgi:hypothetical protein
VAKQEISDLRDAYSAAALAFNAASSTLILKLVTDSLPTGEQIATEEVARAAVVAARRRLWAAYANSVPRDYAHDPKVADEQDNFAHALAESISSW